MPRARVTLVSMWAIFPEHIFLFSIMDMQWLASPACTELEAIVMDWAANLLGLSSAFKNSSGIGGGSIQVRRLLNFSCFHATNTRLDYSL